MAVLPLSFLLRRRWIDSLGMQIVTVRQAFKRRELGLQRKIHVNVLRDKGTAERGKARGIRS